MRIFTVISCLAIASSCFAQSGFPDPAWSPKHDMQKSGVQIGYVHIAAINLSEPVYAGVHESVIDKGVAHWTGSSLPGEAGNALLGAHRVLTIGGQRPGPFFRLDELELGDIIQFGLDTQTLFHYRVQEKRVIDAYNVEYAIYPPHSIEGVLTLFTCHPPGQNTQRLVVRAVLAGTAPAPP